MRIRGSLRAWASGSIRTIIDRSKTVKRETAKGRLARAALFGAEPLESRTMFTATPLYWDPSGAAMASGGSGTWDTSTLEWRSGSTTGALVAWNNTGDANGPYQAVFSAGSGAVTTGSGITAAGISFSTTGYNVSGSSSITLTGIGQIDVSSGATATIGASLSGSVGIDKTGTGTLALSGTNTFSGVATAAAGVVNVYGNQSSATGGWSLGNNNASTPVTVTFQSGSSISVASGKSISINQANTSPSIGILNVAGSVTNSGTLSIARDSALNINSGGSWTQNANMSVGALTNTGYNSTLNINTSGSFTYAGSNPISVSPSTGSSAGNGNFNIAGGMLITGAAFYNPGASSGGVANLTISGGGTLKLSSNISAITSTAGTAFNVQVGTGGGVFDSNGFNATIAQSLSGSGSLSKNGAGVLTLANSNSYAGGTTINSGTILAQNSSTLGSGTVAINNGGSSTASLQLSGGITISNAFAGLNSETAGGVPTFESLGGNNTLASNLSITGGGGNGVIFQNDSGSFTISGNLTTTLSTAATYYLRGSGGVITGNILDDSSNNLSIDESGIGTWTLAGTNTYGGGTVVTGLLQVGNGGSTGTLGVGTVNIGPNATLSFNCSGSATFSNNIVLSAGDGSINVLGSPTTLSGVISGTGPLLATVGTLALAGSNTFSGGVQITSSVILAENSAALGSGTVTINNGGTSTASLQLAGGITISNPFSGFSSETFGNTPTFESLSGNNTITSDISITTTGGNGVIFQSDADQFTVAGNLSTPLTTARSFYFQGSGNGLVSGNITDNSSNVVRVYKYGTGTWTFTGTNTYAVNTSLVSGTLQIGDGGTSGTMGSGIVDVFSGATLILNRSDSPSFPNDFSFQTGAETIQIAGSPSTLSGSLGGLGHINVSSGSLVLSGSNVYTGGTTVVSGELFASNTVGSATGSGAVTVASGAVLGGSGDIGGAVTVNSSGHLAPGNSDGTAGILNTGALTLAAGSNLDVSLNGPVAGDDYDQVIATTISLGGSNLNAGGSIGDFSTNGLRIVTSISGAIQGTFSGIAEGATVVVDGLNFTASYQNGGSFTLARTGSTPTYGLFGSTLVNKSALISINSNHDLGNLDSDGNPVQDNQPDAGTTTNSGYRIRVGSGALDPDLTPLTLHLTGSGTGSYQLTFNSYYISVWDISDALHPVMIQSGHNYTVAVPSGGLDIPLMVEGMNLTYSSATNNGGKLTASYSPSGGGTALADYAYFSVIGASIFVDADNNNGYGLPDGSNIEGADKQNPDAPGKILAAATGDSDGDGIPDYADGYNLDGIAGNADDSAGSGDHFVPVVVQMYNPIDPRHATIRFDYSGSDPMEATDSSPAPGYLRLWLKDGSASRNGADVSAGGDYIQPGVTYLATDLGLAPTSGSTVDHVTLWIEGIRPVNLTDDADRTITMTVDPDGTGNFPVLKPARFTVTINGILGPIVTTSSGTTAYTAGSDPVSLDNGISVIDGIGNQISSATVTLSNDADGLDVLSLPAGGPSGITGSWDDSNATLTLSGTASAAAYQTALESILFNGTGAAGSILATYVVTDTASQQGTATRSILLETPAASLTVSPVSVSPIAGTPLTGQEIATFTGGPTGSTASQYSAVIDWGDGTTSAGTITADSTTSGQFIVSTASDDAHVYVTGGDETITISVTYSPNTLVTGSNSETITVSPAAGLIITGGFTLNATVGVDSGSQTLATFTNVGGSQDISDYSAQIDFGDSSAPVAGDISYSNGVFTVSSNHIYTDINNYEITITVSYDGNAAPPVYSSTAISSPTAPTDISLENNGPVDEGIPVTVSFTGAPDGSTYSYDFWNDGSFSEEGDAANVASPTHQFTFTENGTYTVHGQVTLPSGQSYDYYTSVVVNNVVPVPQITVSGTQKVDGLVVLSASATDPNTDDVISYTWNITNSAISFSDTATGDSNVFTPTAPGTYTVELTASNGAGSQSTSIPVTITGDVPTAPTNLFATETLPGEVDLTWSDDDSTATGYLVTITPDGGGTPATHSIGSNTFNFAATGLTPDDAYTFSVVAQRQFQDGTVVSSDAATITAAPTNDKLTISGPSKVAEDSLESLQLDSGSPSDITSWAVQWTDVNGTAISDNADTITGVSGSDTYPTNVMPEIIAVVTATDSAGISFNLPKFKVDVIPNDYGGITGGPNVSINVDNISATATEAFSGEVATFASTDAPSVQSTYSALILWGDGDISTGAIISLGGNLFQVTGTHTYATPDTAPLIVQIDDGANDPASGLGTATIADKLTIADPATATLEDDGVTVDLSAQGNDAAGDDMLSYKWSVTGGNGATVTFDDNDDNEASNTFATLSAAGDYTFTVTVTNQFGQQVVSQSQEVTANQKATSVSITSSSLSVPVYGTTQLDATELDQFGKPMQSQPPFAWGAGASYSANVSSSGLFTSFSPVTGPVLIYATAEDGADEPYGEISVNVTGDGVFSGTSESSTSISFVIPPIPYGTFAVGQAKGPNDSNFRDYPEFMIGGDSGLLAGLAASSTYSIRLVYYNNLDGSVSYSPSITVTTLAGNNTLGPPATPAAPTGPGQLICNALYSENGKTSVRLSWVDNSNNETGFYIERSIDNGNTFSPLATVPADTQSFSDNNIPAESSLTYKIAAFNSFGVSQYEPLNFFVDSPLSAPSAPIGLTMNVNNTDDTVDLTWEDGDWAARNNQDSYDDNEFGPPPWR